MNGRPLPRLLSVVVAGTMFMAQLDGTVITTTLPKIAQTFRVGALDLSIGITVYLIAQAVALPASAWVAERLGERTVFAGSVMVFTLASIACGLSNSLEVFVLSRAAQGVGAALMTPVGRIVLLRATDRTQVVRIMSMTTTMMLVAPTIGPPLGGFIVTYFSWRWVFFINVPMGLLCCAAILRVVPNLIDPQHRPFDAVGFALTGTAISALLYGLDRVAAPGGVRRATLLWVLMGALAAWAAVRHSRRAKYPLLRLTPVQWATFRITALEGGVLARLPVRALPFLLPLMFQVAMQISAVTSGLLLMTLNAGDLVIKPLIAGTLRRFGYRASIIATIVASSLVIVLMAFVDPRVSVGLAVLCLTLSGMARSLMFTSLNSLVYSDVPENETGNATVLWNVLQQVTNAVAVSFTALVLNVASFWRHGAGAHPQVIDYRTALLVQAVLGVPAVLSFARLPRDAGQTLSGHRPSRER